MFPCNLDEDVDALLQLQPQWLKIADKPLNLKNSSHLEGGFADIFNIENAIQVPSRYNARSPVTAFRFIMGILLTRRMNTEKEKNKKN